MLKHPTIPLEELKKIKRDLKKFLTIDKGEYIDKDFFEYLNSKIPNLEAIVQEEVVSFKETSLNVMSQIG